MIEEKVTANKAASLKKKEQPLIVKPAGINNLLLLQPLK